MSKIVCVPKNIDDVQNVELTGDIIFQMIYYKKNDASIEFFSPFGGFNKIKNKLGEFENRFQFNYPDSITITNKSGKTEVVNLKEYLKQRVKEQCKISIYKCNVAKEIYEDFYFMSKDE